jgi:hypothetical protein
LVVVVVVVVVLVVVVVVTAAVASDLYQELPKGPHSNAAEVTVSACDQDKSTFTPSMVQYACDFN